MLLGETDIAISDIAQPLEPAMPGVCARIGRPGCSTVFRFGLRLCLCPAPDPGVLVPAILGCVVRADRERMYSFSSVEDSTGLEWHLMRLTGVLQSAACKMVWVGSSP